MVEPDILKLKRDEILRVAAQHGVKNIRVFGSYVAGTATASSDIDFLVEFEPGRSLLEHIALMQDLEDMLGHKVDIVTESALHWYVKEPVSYTHLTLPTKRIV